MKKEIDQNALRDRVKKSGLTIQRLAEGSGMSYLTIGNFRRGLSVRPDTAEKIEMFLETIQRNTV